jgi:hypothetical protein
MSSKHTPGPWTYSLNTGVVRSESNDLPKWSHHVICDLRRWSHEGDTFIHPGNARLIAAAPELLEALKEMLEVWEEDHAYGATHADKARAAIAKAEGQA